MRAVQRPSLTVQGTAIAKYCDCRNKWRRVKSMTMRDIITDLAALANPMPDRPNGGADADEVWQMMCDDVGSEREAFEQRLQVVLEFDDDNHYPDPLLHEIAAARNAMLEAEVQMRLLIAYGREFTRPRPYRLEDLARAAGMSISGVRTAYDANEVAEVARRTGAKPIRPIAEAP